MIPNQGPVLNHALDLARRGFDVFPIKPKDKVPATARGFKDASRDELQVWSMFALIPDLKFKRVEPTEHDEYGPGLKFIFEDEKGETATRITGVDPTPKKRLWQNACRHHGRIPEARNQSGFGTLRCEVVPGPGGGRA